MTSPGGLALPSAFSSNGAGPSRPKKRKARPSADVDRALDERDDVDDDELIAAPVRRVEDEDYENEEADGEAEIEVEADGDGDGDGDGEGGRGVVVDGTGDGRGRDGRRGAAGGSGSGSGNGNGRGGGSGRVSGGVPGAAGAGTRRRDRTGEVVLDHREMEKKTRKRKEEAFLLRNEMDPDQAKRFDAFQTAVIPKQAIKRLNREKYDQFCNATLASIIAGLGKIFVAEVVELAKDLQPHSAHPTGPLQPYHLKLARDILEERGILGGPARRGTALKPKRALFRR